MNPKEAPRVDLLLNPFAFPPETRGRFLMLIVAALVFTWSLASYVIYIPNPYTQMFQGAPEVDIIMRKFIVSAESLRDLTRDEIFIIFLSRVASRLGSLIIYQAIRLPLSLFVLMVVITGTTILYLKHPSILRKRHKTQPLTAEEAPSVAGALQRFARRTGLPSSLRLEYKPGFLGGLAFGRRNREVLVLYGSPKFLKNSWNGITQAVALHELAHIANGDIRNREIARAMWLILLGIVTLLAGIVVLASWVTGRFQVPIWYDRSFLASPGPLSSSQELLILVVRIVAMFVVIWWIWAELIRAREFYADWRVTFWNMRESLLQRLGMRPSHPSSWQSYLLHHPSNAMRMKVLRNPLILFRVSPTLGFLTGLLLTVIFAHSAPFFSDLIIIAPCILFPLALVSKYLFAFAYGLIFIAVMVGITYLVTSALGVQVQREAAADLAIRAHGDWGYFRLFKPAFFFALGLEAGLLITPLSALTTARSPFDVLAWLVLFVFLTWIWLIYLRAMTRFWIGSRSGFTRPKHAQRLVTWISVVLLAALFWPALVARAAIHMADKSGLTSSITPSYLEPRECYILLFVVGSLTFFSIVLLFYIAAAGLSLLMTGIWLSLRRTRCPVCDEPVIYRLVIGRRCAGCASYLAGWFYVQPTARPFEQGDVP